MAEVVVVVGAAGGLGTSTFAALLARRRARDGHRVALVDLHDRAGGIEVLLGIENGPGARWPDLRQVRGTVDPADLDGVLPSWEGVEVLSADRRDEPARPEAARAVLDALRGRPGTVVLDTPAHRLLAAGPELPALLDAPSDVLLVAGQDVLGVAGALALRAALDRAAVGGGAQGASGPAGTIQLVLRRRRAARVSPLEAAHVLDLPLVGYLPTDRGIAGAVERGLGPAPVSWSRLARAVDRISRRLGRG